MLDDASLGYSLRVLGRVECGEDWGLWPAVLLDNNNKNNISALSVFVAYRGR